MTKATSKEDLIASFDYHWRVLNGPPLVSEYRFAARYVGLGKGVKDRLAKADMQDWRFDRALPALRIAIEIDGGTWINGGHVRGLGYTSGCIKLGAAASLGWLVFRLTTDMLRDDPERHLRRIMNTITWRQRREEAV
jgi:very-short-patch-repair endonuclease